MKRNKLLTSVVLAVGIAVSLCGCADVNGGGTAITSGTNSNQTFESYPTETNTSSTSSKVIGETSEETGSFPTKCKIYKQTMKLFTEEQLLSLFFGTPEKVETHSEGHIEYKTDTESGFVDDEGYLHFATPAGNKFDTICEMNFLAENNIEGYENEELDFATRDEVLEQVKTLTRDKFGLAPEDLYVKRFYAVKKETFELYKQMVFQEADKPATSGNTYEHKKLNEEAAALKEITGDDYYFISLDFKMDNIPTYSGGAFYYAPNSSNAIIGSKCIIVFTKNGIEYVAMNNIRDTDKASAEEADIISPDEARALMQQKIDSVIWDGEIEGYDMRLAYLPIPQNDLGEYFTNFETRPYYAFYYSMPEKVNDSVIYSNAITYFDAVTGAELGTAMA